MKAIEIISIPVTDQAKAKEFYLNLGFEIMVEAPFEEGKKWVQLAFPDSEVSITLVTWLKNMPAGSIDGLVIQTDDIKAEIETLTSKGIATGPIDTTPWGQFATVKDPDGNRLSLHQRR
ncbi:MAG: glyoxalase [Chitinophagaceae bacterium]|nr:MAG: glyoxalase [Chitinophagaceae bacterium]